MSQVDLHLHTTRSDGTLTPTQMVELVASRGLKVISITDHDSTEGLDEALEAAKAHPQLAVVPGVEMSTDVPGGEVHILAYYVDKDDPTFQQSLERFRKGRYQRGRQMIAKLEALGMRLSWDRVLEIAGDASVGRPHVARALVEHGYVQSTQEAFDSYLGRNGPAYAEREKLTPEEAIELATANGALPVLAHPGYVEDPEAHLPSWKRAGLVGIEVYCHANNQAEVEALLALARRYDLVPCGGSDYHANGHEGETQPGTVGPPMETVERLAALKAQRDRG
ncbi:MAG: PHP domain-containing protein [Dehalococcoidia bacterium]